MNDIFYKTHYTVRIIIIIIIIIIMMMKNHDKKEFGLEI